MRQHCDLQAGSLISVKPPGFGVLAEGVPGAPLLPRSPNPLSVAASLGAIPAKGFSALASYLGSRLKKTSHRDGVEICPATDWEAVGGTKAPAEVLCPTSYRRAHICLTGTGRDVIKLSVQTVGLDAIKGRVTCELRDLVTCRMMV